MPDRLDRGALRVEARAAARGAGGRAWSPVAVLLEVVRPAVAVPVEGSGAAVLVGVHRVRAQSGRAARPLSRSVTRWWSARRRPPASRGPAPASSPPGRPVRRWRSRPGHGRPRRRARAVAVAIAVPVAVPVAIPVAVVRVRVRGRRAVEDHADERGVDLAEDLDRRARCRAWSRCPTPRRAGRRRPWRRAPRRPTPGSSGVESRMHEVAAPLERVDDLLGAPSRQQLGGVRRDGPAGRILRYGLPGHVEDRVVELGLAEQDRREADVVGQPEELVDPRLAQVAADQDDLLARCGDRVGEVRAHRRLAVGGGGRGDEQRLDRLFERHELQRGPQRAEGLCRRRFRLLGGDEEWGLSVLPLRDERDEPDRGASGGELLELGAGAELVVERLAQQRDRDADREARRARRAARRSSASARWAPGSSRRTQLVDV